MALTTVSNPDDNSLRKLFNTEVPAPPTESVEFDELRKLATAALADDPRFNEMPDWRKVAVKAGMIHTVVTFFKFAGDDVVKFVTLLGRIALLEDKLSSLAAENLALQTELKEIKSNL